MSSLNKCLFIGRIGQDVETIRTESGVVISKFSMAVNEKYTNKAGEKVENVTWVNVVCYRKLAEVAETWLKKSSLVYVEGKFNVRNYEDKDGNKRYATEIIANNFQMLGGKSDNQDFNSAPKGKTQAPKSETIADPVGVDPLPF